MFFSAHQEYSLLTYQLDNILVSEDNMSRDIVMPNMTVKVNVPMDTAVLRRIPCKGHMNPCTINFTYTKGSVYQYQQYTDLTVSVFYMSKREEYNP